MHPMTKYRGVAPLGRGTARPCIAARLRPLLQISRHAPRSIECSTLGFRDDRPIFARHEVEPAAIERTRPGFPEERVAIRPGEHFMLAGAALPHRVTPLPLPCLVAVREQ